MAYLTILSGQLAVTEKPRLLLVCDLSRAVARAMKTWATVRAKEKKTQLNEAFFERGGRWVKPPDRRANPRCDAIY
jgi:hypothetical protein